MKCKNCGKEHDGFYGSGKFCSYGCSQSFKAKRAFKGKKHTVETKKKIADTARKSNGREKKEPKDIFDMSTRTQKKVLERMGIGCSICGWDKAACDVHHIIYRKDEGTNVHSNLAYVCPNCHRLIHSGKIKDDELIPFDIFLENLDVNWKDYYYG